jgi:tetratricopeptide (TPR) repeat protein
MIEGQALLMNRSVPAWGVRMTLLLAWLLVSLFASIQAEVEPTDRWQQLTDEGTAAREQASYREAEQMFLAAGREAEQFGATDTRVAATFNNLGLVFHEPGQYARAKSYYEQALAVWGASIRHGTCRCGDRAAQPGGNLSAGRRA